MLPSPRTLLFCVDTYISKQDTHFCYRQILAIHYFTISYAKLFTTALYSNQINLHFKKITNLIHINIYTAQDITNIVCL